MKTSFTEMLEWLEFNIAIECDERSDLIEILNGLLNGDSILLTGPVQLQSWDTIRDGWKDMGGCSINALKDRMKTLDETGGAYRVKPESMTGE
jgi:hypothetical protein